MIKQETNSPGLPVNKPGNKKKTSRASFEFSSDTPGAMECSTGCQADRAALPVDSMVTER